MSARRTSASGFTLLEVMVATLIMAIAVTGLLSSISTSMRSAGKLTAADRSALLAQQKMDELLTATDKLVPGTPLEGNWDENTGWRASVTTFEKPENAAPGSPVLDRVELEVWWMADGHRRNFILEGFHRAPFRPEAAP